MNAIYLDLCIVCLLVGFVQPKPTSDNLSKLSNFLRYVDPLIHEAMTLVDKPTPPIVHPGPIDCAQILKEGNTRSGIYRIWPLNWETLGSFQVYCDMETDSGGWTVIQRRGHFGQPRDYFFKTWKEYQMGFGQPDKDFWLGNDRIFSITDQGNYSLRIDMQDKEGEKRFAIYQQFWIENERQLYKLHITGYSGDAGNSFTTNGMRFSTKDSDNDIAEVENCAQLYKGGWWYDKCHAANLNGLYLDGYHNSFADGINWRTWKGYNYSLPIVDMKIRSMQL